MDLLNGIKSRRSINFFDPEKEIDYENLIEILKISYLALSSFNLQPWKECRAFCYEFDAYSREFGSGSPSN